MQRMRLIAIVVLVAAAAGVALYYFARLPREAGNVPSGGTATSTQPAGAMAIPVPSTPVAASSYGAGAEGSTNGAAVIAKAVGIIRGAASPAAGAKMALADVKVELADPKTNRVLAEMNLDADGSYSFTVAPGEYVLSIATGTGASPQLPQRFYIGANQVVNASFTVR